ncbi:MAG: hypothetical protein P8Q42_05430 [Flavobacteriales bacterium]|nr:hypothetical protein [Flavobacteriales bacterium]
MKKAFLSILVLLILFFGYVFYQRVTTYNNYSIELSSPLSYVDQPSYVEGDTIKCFIHCQNKVKMELFKLDSVLVKFRDYSLKKSIQSDCYSPKAGVFWDNNFSFSSNGLESGYYVLTITENGKVFNQPIIIKPKVAGRIALISSYNTWQAYNDFGGKSNYYDNVSPRIMRWFYDKISIFRPLTYLPFSRPFNFSKYDLTGVVKPIESDYYSHSGELIKKSGIENEDYKPEYDTIQKNSQFLRGEWNLAGFLSKNRINYDVYTDYDFAHDLTVSKHKLLIFHTHSEYWSDEMIGRLAIYLNNGGKVIFASGNNMYRKILYNEFGCIVEPGLISDSLVRGMLGTYYTPTTYPKKSSFKVENANHWVFDGTGMQNGDEFAKHGSGVETDKVGFGSEDFKILASGTNQFGPAHMVLSERSDSSWIFNASSMTFCEEIPRDTILQKILLNLINH